jgi:hypothetical protein
MDMLLGGLAILSESYAYLRGESLLCYLVRLLFLPSCFVRCAFSVSDWYALSAFLFAMVKADRLWSESICFQSLYCLCKVRHHVRYWKARHYERRNGYRARFGKPEVTAWYLLNLPGVKCCDYPGGEMNLWPVGILNVPLLSTKSIYSTQKSYILNHIQLPVPAKLSDQDQEVYRNRVRIHFQRVIHTEKENAVLKKDNARVNLKMSADFADRS